MMDVVVMQVIKEEDECVVARPQGQLLFFQGW